jgi:hypothetical protein
LCDLQKQKLGSGEVGFGFQPYPERGGGAAAAGDRPNPYIYITLLHYFK